MNQKKSKKAFAPVSFFKKAFLELKKVQWPKKKEIVKLTIIVIVISLAIGIYIAGLDYIFIWLTGIIL